MLRIALSLIVCLAAVDAAAQPAPVAVCERPS